MVVVAKPPETAAAGEGGRAGRRVWGGSPFRRMCSIHRPIDRQAPANPSPPPHTHTLPGFVMIILLAGPQPTHPPTHPSPPTDRLAGGGAASTGQQKPKGEEEEEVCMYMYM